MDRRERIGIAGIGIDIMTSAAITATPHVWLWAPFVIGLTMAIGGFWPSIRRRLMSTSPAEGSDMRNNSGIFNTGTNAGSITQINQYGPSDHAGELSRRGRVLAQILNDYRCSNDGILPTLREQLDQAHSYINMELERRGESWRLNAETRRELNLP